MTQQLEVGKTYTSENGREWFCIAVDGDIAHMRYAHNPSAAAYSWHVDGETICFSGGFDAEYRIVFEPERGEVVLEGGSDVDGYWEFDNFNGTIRETHRLTLSTLDGEGELATGTYTGPDGHRIKVEKL